MNKELTLKMLKSRAELLTSRGKNNGAIVKKLIRRIRILENS